MKIIVKPTLRMSFVRGSICFETSAVATLATIQITMMINGMDKGTFIVSKWSITNIEINDTNSNAWKKPFNLFFIFHLMLNLSKHLVYFS